MIRLLLIVSSIILIALIFGVCTAFSLPTEIEEQTTLLDYEQEGNFDYLVYLKPSYLFGPEPQEPPPPEPPPLPPPSNPKYPAEMIDRFDMTFTYWFVPDKPVTKISEQVEVSAVLHKPPPIGEEEVILVPTTDQTGDFTIGFSVNLDDLASSPSTTITANVYTTVETDTGPMFEAFTQSLAMRSDGRLLGVDADLSHSEVGYIGGLSYEQLGEFYYEVRLKWGSPFGAITLTAPPAPSPPQPPPPPPPPPSAKTMGPGEVIFSKLVDKMDMTFSYRFKASRPVHQLSEEVEITAVLENPGVWTKTFALVPPTEKSGDFTINFPLGLHQFAELFTTFQEETGAPASPPTLAIKADVHTTAQTDFGPIDDEFSQTLSTTLGGDVLEWEEELVASKPGAIKRSTIIPNPNKFVGLPITQARNLSASVAGVIFILFLYLLVLNIRFEPEKVSRIEEEALRARKKHKDVIVDIEELPEAKAREMVIQLSSLDELIKAADGLLKPVLHKAEAQKHTYCVIDGLTRYEYISES